ncbi:MAG: hypothetical protein JWM80_5432 [Cyanobacteria bacterium RYN_339]|nr:hypothetical protein [Cyanobacteria bacterium RYN_339]
MRHQTVALIALALVSGCSQPPTAAVPVPPVVTTSGSPVAGPQMLLTAPSPLPTPTPTPTPLRLRLGFEDTPTGSVPADFVDVATEVAAPPGWVYQGNWKVAPDEKGNAVFLHDDVREQPAVSFMRYRGTALGKPNGELPATYYAEVAMRPIRSPINYPPTGDQGVQFYFLKYNQYLEVVVKPDVLEIWECNGGEPKTAKGWKKLWGEALATKAGDVRRIGALVDTKAGNFTAYLDGKPRGAVQSTLLGSQPAWLTLRGIGNVVSFDDLVVEPR